MAKSNGTPIGKEHISNSTYDGRRFVVRIPLTVTLLLVAALHLPLAAESDQTVLDSDSEFQVDVKIVEARRSSLVQLGFDLSPERPDQQSPLSASEFKSKLNELMKLRTLKELGGLPMVASLNKESKYISGGEVTIGEQLFETGTRIEIKPTRQPDGGIRLQWSVSLGEMVQPPKKLLQRKKNPIVNRRQWQGDCIISDNKPVFVIPELAPEQDQIVMLQFHVEELPKPTTASAGSSGQAPIAE
jgi:hypothetical protein